MDLLFAIIPLTIVLGMVAADMGNILYEIEDTIYQSSSDRVAEDTLNTLAETSGDPTDWGIGISPNIVGLAQYDTSTGQPIPDTIDPNKLALLNNNEISNLTGNSTYGFYLTINAINSTIANPYAVSINQTWGNNGVVGNNSSGVNDIVEVNKVVLCPKLESVTSLVGQIIYNGQTIEYTVPPFQTSNESTQYYNYYILFVNTNGNNNSNATVSINNTHNINLNNSAIFNAQLINSSYLNTNSSNPSQFLNTSLTLNVTTSKIGDSMNFYIVQVPVGTPSNYINYANTVPQSCDLTLYLWT